PATRVAGSPLPGASSPEEAVGSQARRPSAWATAPRAQELATRSRMRPCITPIEACLVPSVIMGGATRSNSRANAELARTACPRDNRAGLRLEQFRGLRGE